jgi:lipopolysaccharide heptosyltransferase II
MSHNTIIVGFSFLWPWLAVMWALQVVASICGIRTRGWRWSLLLALLAAGAVWIPIDGMPLARWVAGLNANFSLPFTGLLGVAVWERGGGQRLFSARDWTAAWAFGAISGLLLYPMALGWGKFDPYTWGWDFSPLFVVMAAIAAVLVWRRNQFGLLLLASILGYRLRLLESTNYCDYLVDPIYWVVSVVGLLVAMMPRKMNVEFQRKIDASVGPVICALLSALDRFWPKRPVANPPRRILVILLSEMGSLVLAQGMFARLKQRYPDASLHALLFARNREVLDLMAVIPPTNVLTLDDRSFVRFATDVLKALRTLRALKLDVVIDCELFARVSSILSFLSGARVRVGFHRHTQEGLYRGSFINRRVMYNPYRHISQQFLALAEAVESQTVPVAKEMPEPLPEPPPRLDFSTDELQRVEAQLHADFPSVAERTLVLIYPGGGLLPIRAWPLENYFRLCRALLQDGHAVGIIGTTTEKPLGQAIVAKCQNPCCIDLTGYTQTIRHLLAIFHRASLLVTNDGGPGQFAAVTPLPTIIFFGPETPALYGPLARNSHCFHVPLPCSPCLTAYNHRTSPCDGDNQCLKQITPDQVLAKAREILGPICGVARQEVKPSNPELARQTAR